LLSAESDEKIRPLLSDDEISSGEEDEGNLPPNYWFFAERIRESEGLLKKVKKINEACEDQYSRVKRGIGKAKVETMKHIRAALNVNYEYTLP
jgi:hypothetical protein